MPRPIKYPALYEELTYTLIGIGFSIHKELGPIHKEQVYQNAFARELTDNSIPFNQETRLPVLFKGLPVGVYVPDFVIDNKIILELKAVDILPTTAGTQLNYYLKATGYKIGLLMNLCVS